MTIPVDLPAKCAQSRIDSSSVPFEVGQLVALPSRPITPIPIDIVWFNIKYLN